MNCPHCNRPGTHGRNYCGACGGQLMQYCRSCGFRNLMQDRYCGGCGGGLAEGVGELEAPLASVARPVSELMPEPLPEAPLAAVPSPVTDDGGLAELIAAARDSEKEEPEEGDIKVSQNDIDSLFGD